MNAPRITPHLRAVPDQPQVASERAILKAFEDDDREFGRLFYDHRIRSIDGTLMRVLGERTTEHDDLVQNTFEQILLTLTRGSFKGTCSLKSWACAISTRIGLNAIRSRKVERRYFDRSAESEEVFEHQTSHADDKRLETRNTLVQVRLHIAQLIPARAEALLLHDVLGHELAEVAAITGITVSAAQSRLVRGRKDLRSRLREHELLPKEEQP